MTQTNIQTNIGRIFYKDYYKFLYERNASTDFARANKKLFNTVFERQAVEQVGNSEHSFELTTTYPGLLIGSGYAHESGEKDEAELKIGFFFDYTSGLPVIPGSSVKGILRSVFPDKEKNEGRKAGKVAYVKQLLSETGMSETEANSFNEQDIIKLENLIFEGRTTIFKDEEKNYIPLSIYERDIFFDAVISKSKVKEVKKGSETIIPENAIFANDYITHHENPLQNPNPVQFMKILPNVVFRFNFDLKKSVINGIAISPKVKHKLFEKILRQFGAGAKTNVGYGQFAD